MGLKKIEIQKLIEKLQKRYDECSDKYGKKWFDKNAFEDRLRMALDNRMDLEAFILAEITNFEKIKQKYEKKKNNTSFSDKVDKIIEEQLKRLEKYPKIDFHHSANIEMKYLYGAVNLIYDIYIPALWIVLKNSDFKKYLNDIEFQICELGEKKNERFSKKVEDHITLLSRAGIREIELEKNHNNYLKECAFALYDIVELCDGAVQSREGSFSEPVSFGKSYVSSQTIDKLVKKFGGLTGYGVLLELKEYCEEMLENFRLKAFRRA